MFRSHGEDVMRRAMAVVNVVNQTSTLVPAVLGGVLYAAVGAMPMMEITIVGFGAAAVVGVSSGSALPTAATSAASPRSTTCARPDVSSPANILMCCIWC